MRQDKNNSKNRVQNSNTSPRIRRNESDSDLLPPLRPNARDKNITMPPEYSAHNSDPRRKQTSSDSQKRRPQASPQREQSSSRIQSQNAGAQQRKPGSSQTQRRQIKAQPLQNGSSRASSANQRSKTQQRSTTQQRNAAQQRRKESGAPIIRDSRMSGSGKNRSGSKPASAEKKHIHISKRAAMIVLCVIALFALVGFTGYKFIRVETLTVTGCKTYDPNYVISISGIKTGDHIFSLNKKEIAANIDSDPHLIFNDMQYTFPSTVTLIVTERVGACIFVSDNQYIITDSDGYIVEIDSTKPSSSLPIVTGLTLSKADLGEKYETTDSFRKLILEDLLKQIDAQSLSDIITGIDLTDTNSIKLSTTYGITVNLGQSDDFSSKLSKAATVLENLNKQGKTSGTLDVSTGEAVYRDPSATAQSSASSYSSPSPGSSAGASASASPSPEPEASPSAEPSSSATPESSPSASADPDISSSSPEPDSSSSAASSDPANQLVG